MSERNLLAISIKHSEYKWKFGDPLILWGHRTSDDEPRSFGGYTVIPNHAELYALGDFEGHGYNPEWMKLDEPVKIEVGFCKKWKKYDTVLVEYDQYVKYCEFAGLPLRMPEEKTK